MWLAAQSLLGVAVLPLLAWGLSENRNTLPPRKALRIVLGGLAAQFVIAALLLGVPQARVVFEAVGGAVRGLQEATLIGVRFVFGYLAGAPAPYAEATPANGFILAFRALPLILIMSVLSRVLYHWGVCKSWCAASRPCFAGCSASAVRSVRRRPRRSSSGWSRRHC